MIIDCKVVARAAKILQRIIVACDKFLEQAVNLIVSLKLVHYPLSRFVILVLEKNAFKVVFVQTGVIFVNFDLLRLDASKVISSSKSLYLVSLVFVYQNFLIAFDLL